MAYSDLFDYEFPIPLFFLLAQYTLCSSLVISIQIYSCLLLILTSNGSVPQYVLICSVVQMLRQMIGALDPTRIDGTRVQKQVC